MQFDGTHNMDTMVVEFPIRTPDGTILAKDVTAVQQLEHQKFLQQHWADNSVSVTVYYKPEELPQIKEWLAKNYDSGVKSVSFLLHSGHGFAQAPYEEITEEQYKQMASKVRPITKIDDKEVMSMVDSMECVTGACPVR
jgi:ribonucleoside-diphosphate reductase alpha chain